MLRRFALLAPLTCVLCLMLVAQVLGAEPSADSRVYLPLVMNALAGTQPAPTAGPSGVVVLRSSTSSGSIVGEVQNNTGRNVQYVRVVATLRNAGGEFVGNAYAYAAVDILRPGQRAPFEILSSDLPAEYASYTLFVEWSVTDRQ